MTSQPSIRAILEEAIYYKTDDRKDYLLERTISEIRKRIEGLKNTESFNMRDASITRNETIDEVLWLFKD